MNRMNLVYRTTAAEGASGLSLLVALYDTLACDLQRAAIAQRAGDRERRSRELKHALLIIANLENWIDSKSGDLSRQLLSFYARVRRRILEAQVKESAAILEEEMAETLRLREVWQRLDVRNTSSGPEILPPESQQRYGFSSAAGTEQSQLSWSA